MIKIGIVTINDYTNYGNRLQNYAIQEALKLLGCEVETIVNSPNSSIDMLNRLKKVNQMSLEELFKKLVLKIKSRVTRKRNKKIIELRIKVFKQFTRDNIVETPFVISKENIPNDLADKFDYFVVGSDQVWNPKFRHGSPIDFLTFAPKYKRISYAPSFGISIIPNEYLEHYRIWLSEMAYLSVREDDGAKIIKDLTGRDAPVLVDPTLLLTKEKWMTISKEATNKPNGKYLLTYFLGGVPQNYKGQIKNIAKENNLEVIKLGDIKEKETYGTGPSEFINYINSCSIFCTDSFHGVVFSILMEKPFIVYERMGTSLSMFSRINTLLNKFDLNSRKAENIRTNEEAFNIDYSHVPSLLEAERNKAFNYLKDALNVKDLIKV